MATGKVDFFNDTGGYGFISTEDSDEDVFFHMEDVGGPDLEEGQEVEFEIEDAHYHETPFSDPLEGRDEIREYWRAAAGEAQRDVDVEAETVALGRDHGVATFHASFTRVPEEVDVTLDGVLVARLVGGRCVEFREWWHIEDSREHV